MEAMYEETEVKIITEEVESCYTLMEVSSPKRRKKSKGQADKTDKEKKPRSAFLLYYFDVHQSLQQEFPDLPQSEINKRISESWRMLNVVDKGYYLAKAKLEKEGIDPGRPLAGTSTDLPGFRKILPRRDYVILPKGAVVGEAAGGGSPVEVCVEGGEPPPGGAGGQAMPQDALLSPMELGSEVELSEQCIAIEGLTDETAVALSRSGVLQEILSQYSYSSSPDRLLVKEKLAEVAGASSAVGIVMEDRAVASQTVQENKMDASHLVTIIPNQEVVAAKASPAASSVLLVPVVPSLEPETPQSFKLSIKYTRRGRGHCSTPDCSFSYVTRHKPPNCPNCGQHLGGKWIPAAKRAQAKPATLPIRPETACHSRPGGSAPHAGGPGDGPERRGGPASSRAGGSKDRAPGGRSDSKGSLTPKNALRAAVIPPPGGDIPPPAARPQTPAAPAPLSTANPARGRAKRREKSSRFGPKRPIRAILPAPTHTLHQSPLPPQIQTSTLARASLVQWVALSADRFQYEAPKNSVRAVKSVGKVGGLKPSTLKQLGHAVKLDRPPQEQPAPVNSGPVVVTDKGLKVLSVVSLKHNPTTTLDLGLSTARGRGKCKNPGCNYVYKNRHKPTQCPFCGCELRKKRVEKPKVPADPAPPLSRAGLLDPYRPLTPAQRETQRQSTLQLLRLCAQIPESEAELQDAMATVRALNGAEAVLGAEEGAALEHSGWPGFYESAAQHCALCHFPLFKGGQSSVAGQEDCWLLTDSHIQTATIQLKICLNPHCLSLHSFTDIHPGLFNVGNKLLVSLDLLFRIRNQIRLGSDPGQAALSILQSVQNPPVHALSEGELSHIRELLCSGYWAFECLTVRDYNDMICGVCGIAPRVEIARRNPGNVLQLRDVEFTWPDFQAADEVNSDDFWLTMESEAIEQAAFPASIPITRFDASIIAPFFPPLMRNAVVINTEKDKAVCDAPPRGDPAVLVRLVHDGALKPEQLHELGPPELRDVLERCGAECGPQSTKDELVAEVSALYAHVQNGLAAGPHPPDDVTAGKLYKVCPHQVVCGSKYMVRRESARDHVDLLVSSRYWPPVYVTASARQVALCTDLQYPELASQMWGKNQGCFSDPMGEPEYVSCAELQDHYSLDLSGAESSLVHPVTRSPSRWIVHPGAGGERDPRARHHAMSLCEELEPYRAAVAPPDADADVRSAPLAFDNPAYYYLYNRLVDFLCSKDIVSQQIGEVLQGCQPGEVVIRDALYRLGVAQINTEAELEEEEEAGLPEVEVEMS
ncbi:HMG domain-containing protein 3 [Conger conger]|uniref:HMG domain-containing protein 3 n=1 Tax=Conger conger TaxID=82655 RepID=UPI002A5AA9A5|nr:HMG domain-containing protein 3 [Conger conger]XP_061093105.1 HMG domain-containing protein 3 [Conger conger]